MHQISLSLTTLQHAHVLVCCMAVSPCHNLSPMCHHMSGRGVVTCPYLPAETGHPITSVALHVLVAGLPYAQSVNHFLLQSLSLGSLPPTALVTSSSCACSVLVARSLVYHNMSWWYPSEGLPLVHCCEQAEAHSVVSSVVC